MKKETEDWIRKADGDYSTAQLIMTSASPVWDNACYLYQQSGEKYLKAWLVENNTQPMRTHDLIALLNQSSNTLPELHSERQALAILSTLSIAVRYPGMEAAQQDAEDAEASAEKVRQIIRSRLGLS